MSEPEDDTTSTMLRERLRAHGQAVESQRRPVDVDAILGGTVTLPRRRTARRWTPVMALAAVAAACLIWGAVARPVDEQVAVGPGATEAASGPTGTGGGWV